MKGWMIAGLLVVLVVGAASPAAAQCRYTHDQLVDLIINVAHLDDKIPASVRAKTTEDIYRFKIKLLLDNGFPKLLEGFQSKTAIGREYSVAVLYQAFAKQFGWSARNYQERVVALARAGFLRNTKLDDELCEDEIGVCQYTHGQLVDLLVRMGRLENQIPASVRKQSSEEIYRFKVKMLLARAYPQILEGYTSTSVIGRGYYVAVLFEIVGKQLNCPEGTYKDKIYCLVRAGYLKNEWDDDPLCEDEVAIPVGIPTLDPPDDRRPISPTLPRRP